MRKLIRPLVALIFIVATTTSVAGQNSTPPSFCCGTYTFGEAKAHEHGTLSTYYGTFVDNGLVNDPTNNTGNFFFGNTIHVRQWSFVKVFWYDWSTDSDAAAKLSVWRHNPWSDPLTVQYDPICMLVIDISSPEFP